jgi:hypothetical protein
MAALIIHTMRDLSTELGSILLVLGASFVDDFLSQTLQSAGQIVPFANK